ncbi:11608_t:CDS:2, partial [Gigaspora rosea]
KNKVGLQATESRAIISHKNIGNCKQLQNELFNKQAISLYHRLNEKGAVEAVTDIRINQGFLLVSMSKEGDISECEDIATKVWKHNLACLILVRLNTMQLSLKPDQKGTKSLLRTTTTRHLGKELANMASAKNKQRPIVKVREEFLAELVNKLAMKVKLKPVVEDQRRKEWILESQDATIETVERCDVYNRNKLEKKQSCEKQIERREIGKRKKVEDEINLELSQRLEEVQELGIEVIKNQKLSLVLEELIIRKDYRSTKMRNIIASSLEYRGVLEKQEAIAKEEPQDKDL